MRAPDLLETARLVAIESAALIERPLVEMRRVGSPQCAARYAHLWRCSIEEAALEFGLGIGPVFNAWIDLYPGVPMNPARRGDR